MLYDVRANDAETTVSSLTSPSISSASQNISSTMKDESSPPPKKRAIEKLPDWCDKSKINKVFSKRKKKTPAQRNRDDFEKKAKKTYDDKNYKQAFKIATQQYSDILQGPNAGKHGYGIRSVVDTVNDMYLSSENDKKLKYTTVMDAVREMRIGNSPLKKGRPSAIPIEFTKALAIHATMQQVTSSGGEASGRSMREVIMAMTDGTDWNGKFNVDYAWRRTRTDHPELFILVKAKSHEDRRAEWLTAQNINDWIDGAKAYLIKHNFVIDKPGMICKYIIFVLFIYYLLLDYSDLFLYISFKFICSRPTIRSNSSSPR